MVTDPSSEKSTQNNFHSHEETSSTKHLLDLQRDLQKQELVSAPQHNPKDEKQTFVSEKKRGMSIAFKISGSIVLLILIIVVITCVSLLGMNRLENSLNMIRATSKIARISSEMKSIVYKILLSQTGYIQSHYLKEKQEDYLQLISQDLEKLKKELRNIEEVAQNLQIQFHFYENTEIEEIRRLIEVYENESLSQNKLIQQAEELHNTSTLKIEELEQQLQKILDIAMHLLETTIDDYWILAKKTQNEKSYIASGQVMEKMKNLLFKIKFSIKTLILQDASDASTTELYLQNFLELTEKIRLTQLDEKTLLGITRTKSHIKEYLTVLQKYTFQVKKAADEQRNVRNQIIAHKKNLSEDGNKLLKSLRITTDSNWNTVEDYRRQMDAVYRNNSQILIAMIAISLFLSGCILFFIPRPITKTIDQLVTSSSAIARGNLQNRVQAKSSDELGTLAYMMERMRNSLLLLIGQVSEATIDMSTMTNQVVASSAQQSSSSSEISAQINQLTASVNQQLASMSELRQSLSGVSDFTQNSTFKAQQSVDKAQIALSGMNRISNANTQVSERIQLLREKVEEVTKVLTVISEVADQTNMLSLNASIEATKAGEAGKGFTVVANEVRRLADRSMMAARNVNDIVREVQRAAESAVMSMQKSSEEIRVGSEAVNTSVTNLSEIASNMNQISQQTQTMFTVISQQTDTFKSTSDSIQYIANATALSANAARQISEVIHNLNELVQQLRSAIVKFSV